MCKYRALIRTPPFCPAEPLRAQIHASTMVASGSPARGGVLGGRGLSGVIPSVTPVSPPCRRVCPSVLAPDRRLGDEHPAPGQRPPVLAREVAIPRIQPPCARPTSPRKPSATALALTDPLRPRTARPRVGPGAWRAADLLSYLPSLDLLLPSDRRYPRPGQKKGASGMARAPFHYDDELRRLRGRVRPLVDLVPKLRVT